MDTSKFKLAGVEALGESMKGMVGKPIDSGTIQSIKGASENALQDLVNADVLSSFDVGKVQTKHQSKKLLGRLVDFFLWKTVFRRLYFKPFYVQVSLEDRLRMLREHTGIFDEFSRDEFEKLACSVSGIMIWEEKYPEDPYSIILADITIQPVIPASHISTTVTL